MWKELIMTTLLTALTISLVLCLTACLPDVEVDVPKTFKCSVDGFQYDQQGNPIVDNVGGQLTCTAT